MTGGAAVERDIFEELRRIPLIDAHTHLVGGRLGARGLHDILLYHMSVSDLYTAGCPTGARLTEYPGWPDRGEAARRLEEAVPFLRSTRNTSTAWGIRVLLSDLYGWDEPVTPDNWRACDDLVRERADDAAWHREVLRKAGIEKAGTELARREDGGEDDLLFYSLEWGFFTRTRWGEFDTPLRELERCWGRDPAAPAPIRAAGEGPPSLPSGDFRIRTADDVHEAVSHYVDAIPGDLARSTATHISTDIDLRCVGEAEMAAALQRRDRAGGGERSVYASYVNEALLGALEQKCPHVIFQFSYGAEPLPHETGSRLSQHSIGRVSEMIARHPGLRFHCFLASRHANQSLCTMSRELPNLMMVGYWWHNFFPSAIRQIIDERLDMLPAGNQIGFFSDAYCAEWSYAKAFLVRRQFAAVLAARIRSGQYAPGEAVDIAREVLYTTPRRVFALE